MRTITLTIFILFIHFLSHAENDSVVFSTDGKYVLFKPKNEIRFYLYNKDSQFPLGNIEIENDSAFYITKTGIEEYYLKDFLKLYKLTLNSYSNRKNLSILTDTLKKYVNSKYEPSLNYDIQIKIAVNSQTVFVDTISTNVPDQCVTKTDDLSLYISKDDKYFFLSGWVDERNNDLSIGLMTSSPRKVVVLRQYYR